MNPTQIVNKRNASAFLRANGCTVLRITNRPQRAVIHIDQPTPELQQIAAAFTETVNGQQRTAYYAHVRNCVVHWHEVQQ